MRSKVRAGSLLRGCISLEWFMLPLPRLLFAAALSLSAPARAFCGFHVALADGELFNKASTVVYSRVNDTSVITMSSDYRGDPWDFAMIVPKR